MPAPRRSTEIEKLFAPVDVRAYTSVVDEALIDELRGVERQTIGPMAAARRAEFATARACARAALGDVGIDAEIPRREGGSPQWPEGFAGSISHTRGFCVGVASHGPLAIGIDVEEIGRMKPTIERRILGERERGWLSQVQSSERSRFVATIFAAKEAFYKAHYEVDPRYLGFDAVSVEIAGDEVRFGPDADEVAPELLARSAGRLLIDSGRVIVGVVIGSS